MAALNPYLLFNGNAAEAFNFYRSVFGGEFATVMRNSDIPAGVPKPEGAGDDEIMHIALPIGAGHVLMGGDRPTAFGPGTRGDNFHISVSADSEADATRLFNGLAAGGNVIMPQENTFWGSYFGMLVDKYGIQWMVSYDKNMQQ